MSRLFETLNKRIDKLGLKTPVIGSAMTPTAYFYALGDIVEAMCCVMDERIAALDKSKPTGKAR
jgi:hypothetical protein